MMQPIILTAASIAAVVFYWFWCMNIAYPLKLDRCIRRGQSWLYLPIRWTRFLKLVIRLFTFLLFSITISTSAWALWVTAGALDIRLLFIVFIPYSFFLIGLRKFCFQFRYRQQEDAYFYIRDKINRDMDTSGKMLSDPEISNLASFQHQHILRDADLKGKLREKLKLMRSEAKSWRKNRAALRSSD